MPSFDYSYFDSRTGQALPRKPELRWIGALVFLIVMLINVVLIGLALWYPASWFAAAVFGIPVLTIVGAITWIALYLKSH